MSNIVLEVCDLRVSFASIQALTGVSLKVAEGQRMALIGPNGAGKTTLFNVISGFTNYCAGNVKLHGIELNAVSAATRVRMGLVRTFQVNSLFSDLTVLQSLLIPVFESLGLGARWWLSIKATKNARDRAFYWLAQMGLDSFANTLVSELSYGQQRLLEIALALAREPDVLLLDEPVAGLPADDRAMVADILNTAVSQSVAVLMIEHDMNLVFDFANSIYVLADGVIVDYGTPEHIKSSSAVQKAYLGLL